jgi:elongation factor P
MQFLYRQGREYWFMDTSTFEQMSLDEDQVGDARNFLQDGALVMVLFYNRNPIGVTAPTFIEVKVARTEATLKGAMKQGGFKPATIETGHTVTVPLFVEAGDVIRLDTRTGTYVERLGRK